MGDLVVYNEVLGNVGQFLADSARAAGTLNGLATIVEQAVDMYGNVRLSTHQLMNAADRLDSVTGRFVSRALVTIQNADDALRRFIDDGEFIIY